MSDEEIQKRIERKTAEGQLTIAEKQLAEVREKFQKQEAAILKMIESLKEKLK